MSDVSTYRIANNCPTSISDNRSAASRDTREIYAYIPTQKKTPSTLTGSLNISQPCELKCKHTRYSSLAYSSSVRYNQNSSVSGTLLQVLH